MIAGYEIAWAAKQFGSREAVIFKGERKTFDEVNRRGNKLANALLKLGLKRNERVAVLIPNSLESLDILIGIQKAGMIYVALNTRHVAVEHREIITDSEPTVIFAGCQYKNIIQKATTGLDFVKSIFFVGCNSEVELDYHAFVSSGREEEPNIMVDPEDIIRIQYTSGTTGEPKGVQVTFAQYFARINNFFIGFSDKLNHEDAMVHVGPLTHAAGNFLIPLLLRGARSIILEKFDVSELQFTIQEEKATMLFLVPTMLIRLVENFRPNEYNLSSIRCICYGAAPMPVETLRKGIDIFGPVFRGHYGMVECNQPVAVLYPHEHVLKSSNNNISRLASCGKTTLNINLEIRNTEDIEVSPTQVGEICIEAKGVAATKFWRRPNLDKQNIRNGWLYTGDLAWKDEAGYLFIVGRKNDMIITGGFNVYPREVEEALFQIQYIREVAVVGMPDAEWGEIVCAYIISDQDMELDQQKIINALDGKIANYKKPRQIEFIDVLPRNAAGKVDKEHLRNRYSKKNIG